MMNAPKKTSGKIFFMCVLFFSLLFLSSCTSEETINLVPTEPVSVIEEKVPTDTGSVIVLDQPTEMFAHMVALKNNHPFTATYRSKVIMLPLNYNSDEIWYFEDENNNRMDVVINNVLTRTYVLDGVYTTCMKPIVDTTDYSYGNVDKSVEGEDWTCEDSPLDSVTSVQKDAEEHPENYDVSFTNKQTLVDQLTECFDLENQEGSIILSYCFNEEGIPLYLKVEGTIDGNVVFYERVGKSFSIKVDKDELEPPQN